MNYYFYNIHFHLEEIELVLFNFSIDHICFPCVGKVAFDAWQINIRNNIIAITLSLWIPELLRVTFASLKGIGRILASIPVKGQTFVNL